MAILDDEPPARSLLRALVAQRSDLRLVGDFGVPSEALPELWQQATDLLFLDVRMPEMDAFALLEKVPERLRPQVIFTTAHGEYALRAFDVAAVDYLLKPIDEARFHQAVDRALERLRGDSWRAELSRFLEVVAAVRPAKYLERLPIRSGDRIALRPVDEVSWFEAAGNDVIVHSASGDDRVRDTLKALATVLDPERFLRISRSAIVNVERIREIQPWFHGELLVLLHDGAKVPTTAAYRKGLDQIIRRMPG